MSKVRASFIAVERPGEGGQAQLWGLRRTSDVSNLSEYHENLLSKSPPKNSESATYSPERPLKGGKQQFLPTMTEPDEDTCNIVTNGTGDDDTLQMPTAANEDIGAILKGSPFERSPENAAAMKEPETVQSSSATMPGTTSEKPPIDAKRFKAAADAGEGKSGPKVELSAPKGTQPIKPPATRQVKSSPSTKSPTTLRSPATPPKSLTRGGPAKIRGVMESAKQAEMERKTAANTQPPKNISSLVKGGPSKIKGVMDSAGQAGEERKKASQPRRASPVLTRGGPSKIKGVIDSAATAREAQDIPKRDSSQRLQNGKSAGESSGAITSITSTGHTSSSKPSSPRLGKKPSSRPLVKPRPKSPTRPAGLPRAAMASTAASQARKTSNEERAPSRTDFSRSVRGVPAHSSRTHVPLSRVTETSSSMAKQTSRASLASQTNGAENSKSRTASAKAPDESFLARMTRPTASSSKKAHDKVQLDSPGKKVAGRSAAHKSKHPAGKVVSRKSLGNSVDKENEDVAADKGSEISPKVLRNGAMHGGETEQEASMTNGHDPVTDGEVVDQGPGPAIETSGD